MAQVPIVAFATSKGGSGKTTSCILVAGEIAARGERVLILDTDPQQSAVKWFKRCQAANRLPERIEVVSCLGEAALADRLKALPDDGLVFIDVQGILSPVMAIVAARANVVAVPSRASQLDLEEALPFVQYTAHFRSSGVRVFLNEVEGIARTTQVFKDAVAYLQDNKIPYFRTMLQQRPMFRAITNDKGMLATLDADPESVRKARANVAALTAEILDLLSPPPQQPVAAVAGEGVAEPETREAALAAEAV
ncbi:ParA family protein [Microvirga sp. VF16]|uniref:ParA family protein n=1 Tax=Microvirga sp. VF16 TaxID=2807101 RepID=UPI00193CA586|nr:ParA family protein [Microvirga sp. VF16]QRM32763.1 ParA family protein [Microvirga sp. VF16]